MRQAVTSAVAVGAMLGAMLEREGWLEAESSLVTKVGSMVVIINPHIIVKTGSDNALGSLAKQRS
jgi:hypothetical protein